MKAYFSKIAITLLCIQFTSSYAALDSDWDARIVAFPTPDNGVAEALLDAKLCNDEKSEYKAEVVIEKDLLVDDRHEYWLDLGIQHKYVDTYSYEYYEISEIKLISSKSEKNKKPEKTLRTVKSKPFVIDCHIYKSPLVIYLPYGYIVNYRIWTGPRKINVISPGMMLRSPSKSAPRR